MSLPRRLAASTRSGAVALHQAQDAQTRAEALLGMRLGLHDRLEQRDRRRADLGGLAHHALPASIRRSGGGARHVLGDRRVPVRTAERAWLAIRWPLWKTSTVVSVMRASTVSRNSRERHRVVMAIDLDVIVGRDADSASTRHSGRARSAAH